MTNSDPALTQRRSVRQRPAFSRGPAVAGRPGPSWAADPDPAIHIERRVPPVWGDTRIEEAQYVQDGQSEQFTDGPDFLQEQQPVAPDNIFDDDYPVESHPEAGYAEQSYPGEEYPIGGRTDERFPERAQASQLRRRPHASAPSRKARTLADFERARRHSRMVALLKIGLPAGGLLAVLVIIGVFLFSGSSLSSIEIGNTRIVDGKLVMDNPHLNGMDANQRPYKLTARRAIQDAANPSMITLEEISASLPMAADTFATVTAGSGLYDVEGKKLSLSGKVAVDTADGMSVRLEDAHVNIDTGTLRTDNGVDVDLGRAQVTANTLSIEEKGDLIVFENSVRMTVMPPPAEPGGQTGSLFAPASAATGAIDGGTGTNTQ